MPLSPEQIVALQTEHEALARAARERRSVDLFARAGFEGFGWAIVGGVGGKLFWDSVRPPLFFWPLALLDLLLLWDAVRSWRGARAALQRELAILGRLREVRVLLGIDPAQDAAGGPALRPQTEGP